MIQPIPVVFRKPTPRRCRICRYAIIPLILLRITLIICASLGVELHLANIPQHFWGFIVDVVIISTLVCSIWLGTFLRSIPFFAIALIIIFIYAANLFPFMRELNERAYVAPSGNTSLVVRTKGYMFSGRICYYEKQGVLLKDTKECLLLDDGFQAIAKASVTATWNEAETEVTLTYSDAQTGEWLLEKKVLL